jgi:methionyl-tRNA synthetase
MMMKKNIKERPVFPKRAVVTAGMPYGNKELHFGHIGGVFIHADVYARFLRDRIGEENVIFVSGTDCYGSPILESYRKLKEQSEISVSIEDYVMENHKKQKEALDRYQISLNLYAASAFGQSGKVHNQVSEEVFEALYQKGFLRKLSTPQFYDPEFKVLLNGRQVIGQCPIQGCSSDKGYADECSQGHQYMPSELIHPKSTLSGKTPEVIEVTNWYFGLEDFGELLSEYIGYLRNETNSRKYQISAMEEFLKKPLIYIKKNQLEQLEMVCERLPKHTLHEEQNKASVTVEFDNLKDREEAERILSEQGIYYRTGKTLVPFRLTGNIEWGVKVPGKEGLDQLTFWVWPESLWAPISFTRTYLEQLHKEDSEWKRWWCSQEAKVYQFIGEDNIYFYGLAEMAMFMALQSDQPTMMPKDGDLMLPHLIANNHVLFLDKKASSSSDIKPPMAKELLDHYTPEQLRMHFLSLGLDTKSVSFMPQVYLQHKEGQDNVLKEGNLLTNVYNRMVRSCFYTAQKYYESRIPVGGISDSIRDEAVQAILTYERHMYNHEFHRVTEVLDSYIRGMNKYWVNQIRIAETNQDDELRSQVLIDTLYAVRTIASLLHPIAPTGCEMVRDYLNVSKELWSWDYIFEPLEKFMENKATHRLKFLEPRVDFFQKHESQLEAN